MSKKMVEETIAGERLLVRPRGVHANYGDSLIEVVGQRVRVTTDVVSRAPYVNNWNLVIEYEDYGSWCGSQTEEIEIPGSVIIAIMAVMKRNHGESAVQPGGLFHQTEENENE